MQENIKNEYQEQVQKIDKSDPYYFSLLEHLSEKYERDLADISYQNRMIKKKKRKIKIIKIIKVYRKSKKELKPVMI